MTSDDLPTVPCSASVVLDGRRTTILLAAPPTLDYWRHVTDVPCPCGGVIRWAEAGYVPGYRICDGCGQHYMAIRFAGSPALRAIRGRMTPPPAQAEDYDDE